MNSREISELFQHNISEQFNPIQTFGHRQNVPKAPTNMKTKQKMKIKQNQNQDIEPQQNERQTRIKLLSSYQQSYLQSASQHMFTEQDQPSYDQKARSKYNKASYSESKNQCYKTQNYLYTDPGQEVRSGERFTGEDQLLSIKQQRKEVEHTQMQDNRPTKQALNEHMSISDQGQNAKDKIIILQQAINEEIYNISIQERLYDYLMTRLDERGRHKKLADTNLIVEKAIDFMDSAEDFMGNLVKLKQSAQI